MNTIRLEIQITEHDQDPPYDRDWRGLLHVDGVILNTSYSIDYIALAKSAITSGEYYILTCGCGDTGCAGIDEPISVVHDSGRILWHITDPLPERRFEFSKDEYSSVILEVLRRVQAECPCPEDAYAFPFGYYGFLPHHLDWCIKTLESGVIVGTGYESP